MLEPRSAYTATFVSARLSYDLLRRERTQELLAAHYRPDEPILREHLNSWIFSTSCNVHILVGAVFDLLDTRERWMCAVASHVMLDESRLALLLGAARMVERVGLAHYLAFFDGSVYETLNSLAKGLWEEDLSQIEVSEKSLRAWLTSAYNS